MKGSLSDQCLRDGLRRISQVAGGWLKRSGEEEEEEEEVASIVRMPGC